MGILLKNTGLLTTALLIVLTACSKKDKGSPALPSLGKWQLGELEYTAVSSVRSETWSEKAIKASASNNANTIVFGFKTFPNTSGKYQIVAPFSDFNGAQDVMSIKIYTREGGSGSYFASTNTGVFADVNVSNSKVTISAPLFISRNTADTTDLKTATVSNLSEQ